VFAGETRINVRGENIKPTLQFGLVLIVPSFVISVSSTVKILRHRFAQVKHLFVWQILFDVRKSKVFGIKRFGLHLRLTLI
jgi:hypothetical protein